MFNRFKQFFSLSVFCAMSAAMAQPCPDKNVQYWQAFPPGGESDLSARHQQLVLKKKCAAIETIVNTRPVQAVPSCGPK